MRTPRLQILVIDDDAAYATTLGESLGRDGHEITHARDGQTGIAIARANKPDAVLLDLGLPDANGYEVARDLRGCLPARSVILILTNKTADIPTRGDEQSIDLHLTKPVELELLAGLIHFVHGKRATNRPA